MTLSANTTDTGQTIDESSPGIADAQRTFLFTDVEGSTRLWEQHPAAMRLALARHDALLRHAIGKCNQGWRITYIVDASQACIHDALSGCLDQVGDLQAVA